jgi:hypothetical protein
VFTARYALSPSIKQIRFVFKGLRVERLQASDQKQNCCIGDNGKMSLSWTILTLFIATDSAAEDRMNERMINMQGKKDAC